MSFIPVRVVRKWQTASEIAAFELESASAGTRLPPSSAGAHVDVRVPGGIVRQYSLVNASDAASHYVIGVKREMPSRGGSQAMHERVQQGDILEISAPRNHFPLHDEAARSVLIAGGIGITPILSMARALRAANRHFDFYCFCRSKEHLAFPEWVSELGDGVHCVFGADADQTRRKIAECLQFPQSDSHVYTCGPQAMIETVRSVAQTCGWKLDNVHHELFSAPPLGKPVGKFLVVCARRNMSFIVEPGQTIVEAAAEAGIEILTSCEQGICGTCVTGVISGAVDHRDTYLSKSERAANTMLTPCVSRCTSDELVLDL